MSSVATFPGYTAVAFGNGLKKQENIFNFAQMTCVMIAKQVICIYRIVKYQAKQEKHPDLGSWAPFLELT